MTEDDKLKRFYKENEWSLKNNVVKNFLEIKENKELLEKVIVDPSEENLKQLDDKFKEHFKKIKIIKYISNLIHYYTIDFSKRLNSRNQRYCLKLDEAMYKDSENTTPLVDQLPSPNEVEKEYLNAQQSLDELIEDKSLYHVYQKLTDKQKKILELIYVMNFTNKEVAEFYNETPQNISNLHKRALNLIKKQLQER